MAVKIVRQANKIALLGAPTSAAAMSAGHEGAPAALRAAGLGGPPATIGYDVTDLGDDPVQLYQPDEESPRARNLSRVIASLESLKPRVEMAVKSAALPLILAGDCSDRAGHRGGRAALFPQGQHDLYGPRRGSEYPGDHAFRLCGWHGGFAS